MCRVRQLTLWFATGRWSGCRRASGRRSDFRWRCRDPAVAVSAASEALGLQERIGYTEGIVSALHVLGHAHRASGDTHAARQHHRRLAAIGSLNAAGSRRRSGREPAAAHPACGPTDRPPGRLGSLEPNAARLATPRLRGDGHRPRWASGGGRDRAPLQPASVGVDWLAAAVGSVGGPAEPCRRDRFVRAAQAAKPPRTV